MEHAQVSVIIPVYNMERWLEEALDSVIGQDLRDIEIICINDSSTDASLDILKKYRDKDERIKIIKNDSNEGVAKCRNHGINMACGDYVVFLDPDDYYPTKDILSTLYKKATEFDALICGGGFSDISPEGEIRYGDVFKDNLSGYTFLKEGFISYRDYQFDYGYQRFLFKRDFLLAENISFPILERYQDPPFMVKAFIEAKEFYAIPKVTYCYRYGHKTLNWTNKKVNDFLTGADINLKIAKKGGYEVLYELTLRRIFFDHRYPLFENMISDGDIFKRLETIVLEERDHEVAIRCYQQFVDELFHKYVESKRENIHLSNELILRQKEIDNIKKECQVVKDSVSYSLGLKLTFIPRQIYKWVFKRN